MPTYRRVFEHGSALGIALADPAPTRSSTLPEVKLAQSSLQDSAQLVSAIVLLLRSALPPGRGWLVQADSAAGAAATTPVLVHELQVIKRILLKSARTPDSRLSNECDRDSDSFCMVNGWIRSLPERAETLLMDGTLQQSLCHSAAFTRDESVATWTAECLGALFQTAGHDCKSLGSDSFQPTAPEPPVLILTRNAVDSLKESEPGRGPSALVAVLVCNSPPSSSSLSLFLSLYRTCSMFFFNRIIPLSQTKWRSLLPPAGCNSQ